MVVQYNCLHIGTGISGTGKKSYCLEEGEVEGDGELEDHQQQETEGKLQFHSCQMMRECKFTSLKACNLKVHM